MDEFFYFFFILLGLVYSKIKQNKIIDITRIFFYLQLSFYVMI